MANFLQPPKPIQPVPRRSVPEGTQGLPVQIRLTPEPQQVLQSYWAKDYTESETCPEFWHIAHDPHIEEWPADFRLQKEK